MNNLEIYSNPKYLHNYQSIDICLYKKEVTFPFKVGLLYHPMSLQYNPKNL